MRSSGFIVDASLTWRRGLQSSPVLHEFLAANRDAIIASARSKVAARWAPQATTLELQDGVPLFLEQLIEALRMSTADHPAMVTSAAEHGGDLLKMGSSVAQVVHDYGDLCQAVTELADFRGAAVTVDEFRRFSCLLYDAIAEAVTEYTRLREHSTTDRVFTIDLPRCPGPVAPRGLAPAKDSGSRRVLIVDDEVDVASALLDILVLEGYDARSAYDGAVALRLASEFVPQVVLLDLGMPGLDGYGVARLLRGLLGGQVLLVAMTGSDEDRARLSDAGFDAHVLKPIDVAATLRLLGGPLPAGIATPE
jgi:CheY-like chemotaxis protein